MAHLASSALIFFTVGLFVAVFGQSGYCPGYVPFCTLGYACPSQEWCATSLSGCCCFPTGVPLSRCSDCECCAGNCINGNNCCIQNADTQWNCTFNGGSRSCCNGVCNSIIHTCCGVDGVNACTSGAQCCSGACSSTTGNCCGVDGVDTCTAGSQCCSGACSNSTELCCGVNGVDTCTTGSQCCSGACNSTTSGLCCGVNGVDACTAGSQCCSGACNTTTTELCCGVNGVDTCTSGSQCCSGMCKSSTGKCCGTFGEACTQNSDCCRDFCDPSTGQCGCIDIDIIPLGTTRCNETVQCCKHQLPGPVCLLHICVLSL